MDTQVLRSNGQKGDKHGAITGAEEEEKGLRSAPAPECLFFVPRVEQSNNVKTRAYIDGIGGYGSTGIRFPWLTKRLLYAK